jgi:hypothetical protein
MIEYTHSHTYSSWSIFRPIVVRRVLFTIVGPYAVSYSMCRIKFLQTFAFRSRWNWTVWCIFYFFYFFVILCILLCATNIWLRKISVNTTKMVLRSNQYLILFTVTCFGPHGTIMRQYDKVNWTLNMGPYFGPTRQYYRSCALCYDENYNIVTCRMVRMTKWRILVRMIGFVSTSVTHYLLITLKYRQGETIFMDIKSYEGSVKKKLLTEMFINAK